MEEGRSLLKETLPLFLFWVAFFHDARRIGWRRRVPLRPVNAGGAALTVCGVGGAKKEDSPPLHAHSGKFISPVACRWAGLCAQNKALKRSPCAF